MLKKLILRNFQAHTRLELELDPYITTIIGPNDVGKSTIIRALYWLAFNKPSGDSFIRHGKEFCKVTLELDNTKIARKKSENENTYLLESKEYKSFGVKVPEDIENILNLGDINFQKQLDSPFWFTLTGGEISKEINSIIALSKIDSTLSRLAQEVKKSKMSITITQERIQQSEVDIRENEWVLEAEKDLEEIETLEKEYKEITYELNTLVSLIDEVEVLTNQIEIKEKDYLCRNVELLNIEDVAYKIKETQQIINNLESLISQITDLEIKECELKKNIEVNQKKLKEITGEECPLCEQPIKKTSHRSKKKHS